MLHRDGALVTCQELTTSEFAVLEQAFHHFMTIESDDKEESGDGEDDDEEEGSSW